MAAPTVLRSSRLSDILLWLLRRRRRFRVVGDSMQPLLRPGEEVLIHPRAYRHHPPQPGDIVVACHPADPSLRLIKWIGPEAPPQGYILLGLNLAASTDSRSFGPVDPSHILGQVMCRFP